MAVQDEVFFSDEMSSATFPESMTRVLLSDRPTIESAVKAYMSLVVARTLTSSSTDDWMNMEEPNNDKRNVCVFDTGDARIQALHCARALLATLNSFAIPNETLNTDGAVDKIQQAATTTNGMEHDVIRILWNGLVVNNNDDGKRATNKPTKLLGRHSLKYVYPLLLEQITLDYNNKDHGNERNPDHDEKRRNNPFPPRGVVRESDALLFFKEFGSLSLQPNSDNNREKDDDGCLLWDGDGGRAELARRRERRKIKAASAIMARGNTATTTPATEGNASRNCLTIEEISEEDTDTDGISDTI